MILRVCHDNFITVRIGVALYCSEDVKEEWIFQIGHNHAQGSALAASQSPGMKVRVVVELFNGLHHPKTSSVSDDVVFVQHPRHGGTGNTGALSDFLKT